jgi:hypothetical protein
MSEITKKTKGSHGLHQGSFKLQTMTALIKSFCRGAGGDGFLEKSPPFYIRILPTSITSCFSVNRTVIDFFFSDFLP